MTAAKLTFRPALAADVDAAVPLIYSSGSAAFDDVFAVPSHGKVVAAGAGFGGATKWPFTLAAARRFSTTMAGVMPLG